eukprot:GHVS01105674.1.p1 GENE.GHVS01105674.1~~GHVS01105674.1.p1  ORF type:complete len:100 (+),score=17.78 GHVS01105674.1:144-443(+)
MESFTQKELVIDGETEMDDLLVAAKIAELECMKAQVLHQPFQAAPRPQRPVSGEESDSDGDEDSDRGELNRRQQKEIDEVSLLFFVSSYLLDVTWIYVV